MDSQLDFWNSATRLLAVHSRRSEVIVVDRRSIEMVHDHASVSSRVFSHTMSLTWRPGPCLVLTEVHQPILL
jgi:hypothetical protein